jgi:hypothetical protein
MKVDTPAIFTAEPSETVLVSLGGEAPRLSTEH